MVLSKVGANDCVRFTEELIRTSEVATGATALVTMTVDGVEYGVKYAVLEITAGVRYGVG